MADFPMCGFCEGEYKDPASRRYHAQTISCHSCGPQPKLETEEKGSGLIASAPFYTLREDVAPFVFRRDSHTYENAGVFTDVVNLLKTGGIAAVKGVGGYYLACTPFDEEAVQKLRGIKHREQKPFAVMFNDAEQVKEYCVVSPQEEAALTSPQRPILLLEQRPDANIKRTVSVVFRPLAPGVNNTSRFVGAFLPSFGLQYLLLEKAGPLIMTSANLSELPLITQDEEIANMAAHESRIEGLFYNKRRIVSGLDDSVARVVDGEAQLIRRSKGYVPAPVFVQAADSLTKETCIFAAGGHLKSAFALSKGAYSYLSRHIGDLESMESENVYAETYERMTEFFEIDPGLAVCDLHPRYFPTRFAEGLGLPLIYAQHHHAHIASVMAEHGLKEPVIGVGFDGTGYGTDEAIWGGEILLCEGASCERFSHLRYIDMIGGDASMKDAWKSAISHLYGQRKPERQEFEIDLSPFAAYSEAQGTLDRLKAMNEGAAVLAALKAGVNTVKSSSMGRLFDAVCAMLGIHYENRYEGECAILLENAAQRALTKQKFGEKPAERERLALFFHLEVAQAILSQCRRIREQRYVHKVCLSGGVFQNKILMEETLRLLRGDYLTPYYNIHVPPNDGGLALGQNYIGMLSR